MTVYAVAQYLLHTEVSIHFGPKTFRHHQTGAKLSGQFGTSAEVSRGHFGTGTKLSRPPASIFATIGRTEEFLKILLVIIIKQDHLFTQEYTAVD